jgi:hypothetical protein
MLQWFVMVNVDHIDVLKLLRVSDSCPGFHLWQTQERGRHTGLLEDVKKQGVLDDQFQALFSQL